MNTCRLRKNIVGKKRYLIDGEIPNNKKRRSQKQTSLSKVNCNKEKRIGTKRDVDVDVERNLNLSNLVCNNKIAPLDEKANSNLKTMKTLCDRDEKSMSMCV